MFFKQRTAPLTPEQVLQNSIDAAEEAFTEALAFEAKGNKKAAEMYFALAEEIEAKAFQGR